MEDNRSSGDQGEAVLVVCIDFIIPIRYLHRSTMKNSCMQQLSNDNISTSEQVKAHTEQEWEPLVK